MGFDAVTFSCPRRERFGSSSLVSSEDSELMEQGREEILSALDSIKRLKKRFACSIRVPRSMRSHASARRGAARHLRRRPQIFYIDWKLDVCGVSRGPSRWGRCSPGSPS